jgi:hypothetical protein
MSYQMAKEAIQSFPAIPSFNMKNSPRAIGCLRAEMAEELLSASGIFIQLLGLSIRAIA